MDVVGSSTGKLLPTGKVSDVIDGEEVTCLDVAMPMITMRRQISASPARSRAEINPTTGDAGPIETHSAGSRPPMGFGDVTDKVIPKVGICSDRRATAAP